MSRIMVDDLVAWPLPKNASAQARRVFGGRESCHMTTDGGVEELHAFALKIGMKRVWFQDHPVMKHYDLTASRRADALAAGATHVSAREQAIARRAKRGGEWICDGCGKRESWGIGWHTIGGVASLANVTPDGPKEMAVCSRACEASALSKVQASNA